MDFNLQFREWLRVQRHKRGLTQAELADQVEYSTITIRKIEAGGRPSLGLAKKLAEFFEIPEEQRAWFFIFAQGRLHDAPLHHLNSHASSPSIPKLMTERRTNLPALLTSFVGRKEALASLRKLFQRHDVRLVTLVGTPGIGKTRLALQLASDMLDEFDDGVLFIRLEATRDQAGVISAIAQELGVRETNEQPLIESLKDFLQPKQLLLILDNFEQVVNAAPLVTELLQAAPGIKALVTSRTLLRLQGEWKFEVLPLSVPQDFRQLPMKEVAQSEAVILFVERATHILGAFELTKENVSTVAEICGLLDGIPLGIELFVGHIQSLTPDYVLQQLRENTRLKLLTVGFQDQPERHQTLSNAFAWSYDLLESHEQLLFRRLSIFVGGFTLEAAVAICSGSSDLGIEVHNGIISLVSKSLVEVSQQQSERRFRLLETTREYGWEQLVIHEEQEALERQHAAYYAAFARRIDPELTGPQQTTLLKILEAELDNLRRAVQWFAVKEDDLAFLELTISLYHLWYRRGLFTEGRSWFKQALERSGSLNAPLARAKALYRVGTLAYWHADPIAALSHFEDSLTISRGLGDKRGVALALAWKGQIGIDQANIPLAQSLFEDSFVIAQEQDDKNIIAHIHIGLGMVAYYKNSYSEAIYHFGASVSIRRAMGHWGGMTGPLVWLGWSNICQGDFIQARANLTESLMLRQSVGYDSGIPACLEGFASLAAAVGQPERAVQLMGAAEALLKKMNIIIPPNERLEHDKTVALVRPHLTPKQFSAAWMAGYSLSLEQAVTYALEENAPSSSNE